MKNIRFSEQTYNQLSLLKKGRSFEELLNAMSNYFIKSELDVFNLRPYAEDAILAELNVLKKQEERIIKILKAQEKEYKSLFATKNDLPKPAVSDKYIENITIEQLEEQGLTNEELLSLIDAAQENNSTIQKQEQRIQELEKLLSDRQINHAKDTEIKTKENNLLSMDFKEAFTHFLKFEKDLKITVFITLNEESQKYLDIMNSLSVSFNYEKKQIYDKYFGILIYKKELKTFAVARDDMEEYYQVKNKLLTL